MHKAANAGDQQTIQTLISCSKDIDPVDDFGDTPIVFAVLSGHMEAVKMLADAGAKLSFRSMIVRVCYRFFDQFYSKYHRMAKG